MSYIAAKCAVKMVALIPLEHRIDMPPESDKDGIVESAVHSTTKKNGGPRPNGKNGSTIQRRISELLCCKAPGAELAATQLIVRPTPLQLPKV